MSVQIGCYEFDLDGWMSQRWFFSNYDAVRTRPHARHDEEEVRFDFQYDNIYTSCKQLAVVSRNDTISTGKC